MKTRITKGELRMNLTTSYGRYEIVYTTPKTKQVKRAFVNDATLFDEYQDASYFLPVRLANKLIYIVNHK
ncbi:MAG: hypothetical protein IJ736_01000 [Firmicutes bacterium]|nr:hypothetical protein [Bacillota bacterium]